MPAVLDGIYVAQSRDVGHKACCHCLVWCASSFYVYPCTATVLLARYNTAMENEVRKSGDALRVVFQNTWSKANLEEDWVKYEALLAAEVSRAGNFSLLAAPLI